MGNEIYLDYERLKKCISDRMPAEYLNESIVEVKYYDGQFFYAELNFNPHKRGGAILPHEYRYYDKECITDNKGNVISGEYSFPKGFDWLPTYFWATEIYNEREKILPVAFISIFMRHFIKSYIEKRYGDLPNEFNYRDLLKLSDKELHDNDYETPHVNCKNLLFTHYDSGLNDMVLSLCKDECEITEDILSDIIIACIKFTTDNYHMERWSYPDEEIERAERVHKDCSLSFQEDLIKKIYS